MVEEQSVNHIDGDFDDYKREVLESLGEVVVAKSKDKEWREAMRNTVPQVGEGWIPLYNGPIYIWKNGEEIPIFLFPSYCLVNEENANKYLYIGWMQLCDFKKN